MEWKNIPIRIRKQNLNRIKKTKLKYEAQLEDEVGPKHTIWENAEKED